VNTCAVIATHHKTGSVWMSSIFRRIGQVLGVRYADVKWWIGFDSQSHVVPSILFNDHSSFQKCSWLLEHPQSRILHVIRDPRDVLLSAMSYHRKATEPWLHTPKKIFDRMTYQEKLNSLPDDNARYLFEMHNSAGQTIKDMKNWAYGNPNTIECKYEELIEDSDLIIFTNILFHLGFNDENIGICQTVIRNNSIFGKVNKQRKSHIRAGHSKQWREKFSVGMAEEFVSLFGSALVELGYEDDNSWVDELRSARAAG
jgi:hypothetical protein